VDVQYRTFRVAGSVCEQSSC